MWNKERFRRPFGSPDKVFQSGDAPVVLRDQNSSFDLPVDKECKFVHSQEWKGGSHCRKVNFIRNGVEKIRCLPHFSFLVFIVLFTDFERQDDQYAYESRPRRFIRREFLEDSDFQERSILFFFNCRPNPNRQRICKWCNVRCHGFGIFPLRIRFAIASSWDVAFQPIHLFVLCVQYRCQYTLFEQISSLRVFLLLLWQDLVLV